MGFVKTKITPVILSGGEGSRLWPLSRQNTPKQFIPILGDKNSFELTLERVNNPEIYNPIIVICSTAQKFLIHDLLSHAGIKDSIVIAEPARRNTAPALCAAICAAFDDELGLHPDSPLLLLPADHHIKDHAHFNQTALQAKTFADQGKIVTFGITPSTPHTGFGYIQRDQSIGEQAYGVKHFKEKPDIKTAQSYIDSQDYYWNAGIFIGQASAFKEDLQLHAPDMLAHVQKAWNNKRKDLGSYILDSVFFEKAQNTSIDYAIMEKTNRASIIEASFDWSDLGSWDALWDISHKDPNNNVCEGDVLAIDSENSFLYSENKLLCTVGIKDIIAVNTHDALLIAPRDRSEEVKTVVNTLKTSKREEAHTGRRTMRPWGFYDVIENAPNYKIKRVDIYPGKRLSLQYHNHRSEHWVVLEGTAHIIRGDEAFDLEKNQSVYIPRGSVHRIENKTDQPLSIIEIQTGNYFGEDDIVRLEDDFNRN